MNRINPEDWENWADRLEIKKPVRIKKKKDQSPTKSDKEQQKREMVRLAKERKKEAETRIKKRLSHFPDPGTKEAERQLQIYTQWLEESIRLNSAQVKESELETKGILSKVKAGGQHQQKNLTAVFIKHLPTGFSSRNEEERSFEQNRQEALAELISRLENHLQDWKIVLEGLPRPVNLEAKIKYIFEGQISGNAS